MAARRPSGLRPLGILLLAVAVVATVPVAALAAFLPRFVIPPPPPLRIDSVSISPDPPSPYAEVTVTVRLSKAAANVGLGYIAALGSTFAGGTSMQPAESRTYRTNLGPFANGTEVWFVVTAATSDEVASSDFSVFQVGTVLRGGPSGLRIDSIARTPDQPQPHDSVVVTANITANGNYTEAFVESFVILSGAAVGDFFRMDGYGTDFSGRIYAYPSALVAYRIVAQDTTGNTAVSEVFSFQVPSPPGPVP